MRSITSFVVVLCLGFALAVPAPKKLEKKSISESLAPKAIEPVDQKLDEPKLSDEALMETAGENVDRAKKQASTTFCVEIRQNKPTQVDCDELNNRPMPPPPPPPPAPIIEPQEPAPAPPRPQIVPQLQPAQPGIQFELPCEPEIAAYYTQPAGEIIYAPTGNCAQHVPANIPTLVHVPSAPYGHSPFFNVPAGGSGAPSIHVLHLPSGGAGHPSFSLTPSTGGLGGHGLFPLHSTGGASIHLQPGSLLPSGGSGSLLPLHQAGGPGGLAPSTSVSAGVHVIQPSIVAPILPQHGLHGSGLPGIGSGGVNLHVHGGLPSGSGAGGVPHTHGVQLSGVECTCTEQGTILAKSSGGDGSPSNEALAVKFLQDLQRNAAQKSSSSSPVMITSGSGMPLMSGDGSAPTMRMSSGSPSGSVGISSGTPTITMTMPSGASPVMGAKSALLQKLQGRHHGYVRPVIQEQVVYRPAGIHGLHGLPLRGVPVVYTSGLYPSGIIRSSSKDPCLEDSFQTHPMAQGLRLSRDEEGSDKKSSQESKSNNQDEAKNASTSGTLDQLKNNPTFDPQNSDYKDKPKNSDRVARFLMNDDVSASNRLDAE